MPQPPRRTARNAGAGCLGLRALVCSATAMRREGRFQLRADLNPQGDQPQAIAGLPAPANAPEGTFQPRANFDPQGDQPQAIADLTAGVREGARHQVLLGVTGSGKTFTVSHVVAAVNKPTLVIAPNKTLAAQLFHEFRTFFPENAVRYFVSYYDYYQPEAYVPSSDTYIAKDASINDEIDKMRHAATKALLERNGVLVVASVSCIYGLGSPASYFDMLVVLERNDTVE